MLWYSGALLISLVSTSILLWKYKDRTKPWEYVIIWVSPFILAILFQFISIKIATHDKEYLGTFTISAIDFHILS